jgi:heat shock protein HslJ
MVFQPQPPASLSGSAWRVQSYNNGRGGLSSVLGGAELTATFAEDGSVSGNTGCNLYRGSYSVAGSTITLSQLINTRRACIQPELNEQEQAFLRALEASASYELVGDRLTLSDAAGTRQVALVRPTR